MARPDRPLTEDPVQPPGVEGDGMDPYPTYREGPTTPHHATASKPTDTDLPRSRRSYALPMLLGLVVFGLIVLAYALWGGVNAVRTANGVPPGNEAPATTGSVKTPAPPAEVPAPAPSKSSGG
jgi:hypothetical protein